MSWLRLDDQIADHPKIVVVGPLAFILHVKAMIWCSKHLTDGQFPKAILRSLVDWDTEKVGVCNAVTNAYTPPNNFELADRLVAAGVWSRTEDGFTIHDYLEYQPSRSKVLADRAAIKDRVTKYRHRSNAVSNAVTNATCNAVTNGAVTPLPFPSEKEINTSRAHALQEPDQIWLELTGIFPNTGLAEVVHLCHQAAERKVPPIAPEIYFRTAIKVFVEWVDNGCDPGKQPPKSPQKFIEHFPRIQEMVDGKRKAKPPPPRDAAERPRIRDWEEVLAEKRRKAALE